MRATRQTATAIIPTNCTELLHAIAGGQDPLLSVALFARHVEAAENGAWSRREDWQRRGTPAAAREASLQYGRADAFSSVLGDKANLSKAIAMRVPGL